MYIAGFNDGLNARQEISDSKRSGRRDEPDFMESNASAQIALLVSDDAQRVTAPNKSQDKMPTPHCGEGTGCVFPERVNCVGCEYSL
jgi:hypothetical protein